MPDGKNDMQWSYVGSLYIVHSSTAVACHVVFQMKMSVLLQSWGRTEDSSRVLWKDLLIRVQEESLTRSRTHRSAIEAVPADSRSPRIVARSGSMCVHDWKSIRTFCRVAAFWTRNLPTVAGLKSTFRKVIVLKLTNSTSGTRFSKL